MSENTPGGVSGNAYGSVSENHYGNAPGNGAARGAGPGGRSRRLSNVTRCLCAGAYIDPSFRAAVLSELLDDPRRAVVPSPPAEDVDLWPVLLHCLKARNLTLIRDGLISVLLVLAILSDFTSTLVIAMALVPLALLGAGRLRSMKIARGGPSVWIGPILLGVVILIVLTLLVRTVAAWFDEYGGDGPALSPAPVILVFGAFLVAFGYWIYWYRTVSVTLGPGAIHADPPGTLPNAARLDYVDRAQKGNLTLYGNEDPFIGAGNIQRSWSIVVELDRPKASLNGPSGTRRRKVTIDPVELHAHIEQRLREMRDDVVEPQESIRQLHVSDHLAGRGTLRRSDWSGGLTGKAWNDRSHPLLGPDGAPRSTVPEDHIQTIIRNPQAGLRYYRRVTVAVENPALADPGGELIVPGEDQEVTVSAFIYLAVEGRLLYTQFVVTALPPVRADFHVIDVLPTLKTPQIVLQAVRSFKLRLVAEVIFAPLYLLGGLWQMVMRQFDEKDPRHSPVYSFGATRSVRELGAETHASTFTQRLDIDKYSKLIQQRLTEAVLDFLEEHDVDTAGYRQQAAALHNYGVMISGGNVSGPLAAGAGAQAVINQPQS